jgi:hypothetical protein
MNQPDMTDNSVGKQCLVLAFDPGETTGWAAMGVNSEVLYGAKDPNDKLQSQLCLFKYGQITCLGPKTGWTSQGAVMENQGVLRMLELAVEYKDCAIVFEDFIVDFNQITMDRSALSSVTVMAKFEMAFDTYNYGNSDHPKYNHKNMERIFRQNRSPVKTTMTDTRLTNLGLYDKRSGPHARDAVRHAYYFLRNCRGASLKAREARWRAWPHIFNDPMPEEIKNDYYRTQERRKGTRIERLG